MLEYVAQTLPGVTGGGAALDLGVARRVVRGTWGQVDVAGSVQHLGGELQTGAVSSPLPRTWRAGVSLTEHGLARAR